MTNVFFSWHQVRIRMRWMRILMDIDTKMYPSGGSIYDPPISIHDPPQNEQHPYGILHKCTGTVGTSTLSRKISIIGLLALHTS